MALFLSERAKKLIRAAGCSDCNGAARLNSLVVSFLDNMRKLGCLLDMKVRDIYDKD